MSTLHMVRHGQASVRAADYDKLSVTGVRQSGLLGESWARQGLRPDAVFVGPRKRHLETWQAMAEGFSTAGIAVPTAKRIDELDEHAGQSVLAQALPLLVADHPEIPTLIKELQKGTSTAERRFLELYQQVTRRWVRGELTFQDVETWPAFRRRVQKALDTVQRECQAGKTVFAITSGGPVAATMGSAMQLSDEKVLELSWIVRNASTSEFLYSKDRFSALSFNNTAHMVEHNLITFI